MAFARKLKKAKAARGLLDGFDLQLVRLHLRLARLPASGVDRTVQNENSLSSGTRAGTGEEALTPNTYRRLCSKCVTAWKGDTVALLSVPSR